MTELSCCEVTPAAKQYRRSMLIAAVGYNLTLVLAISFLRAYPQSIWTIPLMLTPVFPAVFGLVAVMRFVRSMDELQRRVQLEGVAFAFTVTIVITLTWGMMERAGLPHLPSVWVAAMMIGLWALGSRLAAKRYR